MTAHEVDPDNSNLVCQTAASQPLGFQGFEAFGDGTALNSTVPGLTLDGWTAGDFSTGNYRGKFPAGDFSSQQTHFATAASNSPTINLAAPASTVSVLADVAAGENVTMTARDSHNVVLVSGSHVKSPDGRHMVQFQIAGPTKRIRSIDVDVPPTGDGFFTLDAVCTDDAEVPPGQLTLKLADGPPGTTSFIHGYGFAVGERVEVSVAGHPTSKSPKTDASGHFDLAFTMPSTAQPGSNEILAVGDDSGISATANFFVHTDWNQSGFDAQKTGFNPHENTLNIANVTTGLHSAWTAELGGSQVSSAALAKGVAYVASEDVSAYAFEENSANDPPTKVAEVATGGAIFPTPAVDVDRVFIDGSDGRIYSFDPQLGPDTEWAYPRKNKPTKFVFNRSPAVLDLVLYAVDSRGGNVFAMNESSGRPYWTVKLPAKIHSSPAVDDKHVYVGTDDGTLYAINRATHAIDWRAPAGSQRLGNPVLSSTKAANGKVFIGSQDGHLYAFNTADGSPGWNAPITLNYPLDQAVAVANNVVYVGLGDPAGTLQARSVLTGKRAWRVATGGAILSKPTIANGVVYVTNTSGDLVALNPNGSGVIQRYAVGSTSPSAPAVDNGAIYVGTGDGRLVKVVAGPAPQIRRTRRASS